MTLKAYIWGIRVIFLLTLLAFGAVIVYIDPQKSGPMGIALFYLMFFLAVGAMFNLFLLFIRRKLLGDELAAHSVGLSFRQGILLSVTIVAFLALQSYRALIWWDALLVIAGVFLIELYFLSKT